MFSEKYITRKIDQYKMRKREMLEKDLPFRGIKFRRSIRNLLRKILFIKSKICGLTYEFVNMSTPPKNENVIYAVTHIGKYDFEMLMEAYGAFFYPFAGDWELDYGTIDDYFLRLCGVIYIDTNDKEDRKRSFGVMQKAIKQGIPILIFPEGIWNLTENLPVMKLYSGAVRAAQACKVPIIPIGMEQIGKHFYINVGKQLEFTLLTEAEALIKLRDEMASLRWQIWERLPVTKRSDIADIIMILL